MPKKTEKTSMFLILAHHELVALSQVAHEGMALYLVLKSKSNFRTGYVGPFAGAVITLCELGTLIERRIKGVKRQTYSSQDVHRILDRLAKAGLISDLKIDKASGVSLRIGASHITTSSAPALGCDVNKVSKGVGLTKHVTDLPPANAHPSGISAPLEGSTCNDVAPSCDTSQDRLCVQSSESPAQCGSQPSVSNVFSSQKSEKHLMPPQPPGARGAVREFEGSKPTAAIEKLEAKKYRTPNQTRQLAEHKERQNTGGVIL